MAHSIPFLWIRHRQEIRVRMLDFRKILGSPHNALQTVIIQLVGGCARRATAEGRTNGNAVIRLGNVLMNDVIRKSSKRRLPTVKKHFDFVSRRVLFDALKNVGSFFFAEH